LRPKPEEYLIETQVGAFTRKVVWHADEELDLDFPRSWKISKVNGKIIVRDTSSHSEKDRSIEIPGIEEGDERRFQLPPALSGPGSKRSMAVEIVKLKSSRPVYVNPPTQTALSTTSPKQLCAFYGQRYFLIRYRPIGPQHVVHLGNLPAFEYIKSVSGFTVSGLQVGFKINVGGRIIVANPGNPVHLSDVDFFRSTLVLGIHWWRFRMVPTPDGQPPLETDETDDDLREKNRLHYSTVALLSFTSLFLFATYFLVKMFPPPAKRVVTEVTIRQPKIMPAFEEIKKPEPPPPPKVVEIEKPKPPEPKVELKPEPVTPPPKPKVVSQPPAPKKPAPKVVEHKAPPKKVVRAERPPPPKPEPALQPPPEKVADPGPSPEQLRAAEKAKEQVAEQKQLLKSLNFLSSNKSATATDPAKYESKTGKFADTQVAGDVIAKSNALDKITKGAPGDSSIKTKSGRGVASNVTFGRNKGLNNVEGKVSEGELYSKNGNPGEALGSGKGIEMSGPGTLTDSQIEKALAKFASRFQYCYEKALLSDSSLGGSVTVQWTVTSAGRASAPSIVKSQLNNADLHACVLKVLGDVPFPKPKGGSVTVKKPFSFSSSSI
jgi:hypothetical protein